MATKKVKNNEWIDKLLSKLFFLNDDESYNQNKNEELEEDVESIYSYYENKNEQQYCFHIFSFWFY